MKIIIEDEVKYLSFPLEDLEEKTIRHFLEKIPLDSVVSNTLQNELERREHGDNDGEFVELWM